VNADCIRMTSYFGERGRAGGRAAHALIDLYAGQRVTTSILLRGIWVTLAEDLPLTAIAVDTRPAIETVLDQVLELTGPGLVTQERVVLLSDEIDPVGVASHLGESTKLCFFLGSHDRVYGAPAFEAVCELLHRRGIAGATVLPGVDGTAHGRRQRSQFLSRNAEVPLMITAVDCGDRIGLVLPELGNLVRRPLITLEPVRVCKRDGQFLSSPDNAEGTGDHGFPLWQKLTVYTTGGARHGGQPTHRAIVRELRSAGIGGATSHRGILGFHGDQPPHAEHFPPLSRHAPVVTTVVAPADRAPAAFGIIDKFTSERGIVTSEIVPVFHTTSAHRRADGPPRPRL
jgi:PII-like signaling protein